LSALLLLLRSPGVALLAAPPVVPAHTPPAWPDCTAPLASCGTNFPTRLHCPHSPAWNSHEPPRQPIFCRNTHHLPCLPVSRTAAAWL